MDTIFIRDLRVDTRIGVYDWEQHVSQPLMIDLEFAAPSPAPFRSDRLADAVDYSAVVARIKAFAQEHPHRLVERFAEALADDLRQSFALPSLTLTVAKLSPVPGTGRAGVRIVRG
jgi:dihydroneopterin aldolase